MMTNLVALARVVTYVANNQCWLCQLSYYYACVCVCVCVCVDIDTYGDRGSVLPLLADNDWDDMLAGDVTPVAVVDDDEPDDGDFVCDPPLLGDEFIGAINGVLANRITAERRIAFGDPPSLLLFSILRSINA
jgi:hypothetical protein